MVYASIERCPYLDGDIDKYDKSAALAIKGVLDVVALPRPNVMGKIESYHTAGVAVIAESYWATQKGRKALKIDWSPSAVPHYSSDYIQRKSLEMLDQSEPT